MFGWVSPLSRVLTPKAGGNTEKVSEQNGGGGLVLLGLRNVGLQSSSKGPLGRGLFSE